MVGYICTCAYWVSLVYMMAGFVTSYGVVARMHASVGVARLACMRVMTLYMR